jgi:hypothetical protein
MNAGMHDVRTGQWLLEIVLARAYMSNVTINLAMF